MKIYIQYLNKRPLVLYMWLLMALSVNSYAQIHLEIIKNSKTRNFQQIVKIVEEYYKDKDKGKGSGYTQFKRWEYHNRYRLDSQGNIQDIANRNFKEIFEYNLKAARKGNLRTDIYTGNWAPIGPTSYINGTNGYNGGLGRVSCIAVDPANSNTVYVGTPAGGLWRSTVGGNAWTSITDGISSLGVSGIAIDPTSPANNRTIYILTGDGDASNTYSTGVLRSVDNGATWQSTGLSWPVTNYTKGYKLIMHPSNNQILLAVTTQGIYRTTNAGLSWTQVVTSGTFYDIEFKPGDPNTVYAVADGAFYKSTNAGVNWSQITSGVPNIGRLAIAVSANNANYVYILQGYVPTSGQFGGVYRSTNSGTSFSLRSNTPNILGYDQFGNDNSNQAWYDLAIAASPTNAEEVHTGGINCWKSLDGGTTWQNTSFWIEPSAGTGNYTHADIHAVEFFGSTLYCGSDGGVTKSTNNANDWTIIWNGLQIAQPYKISVDGSNPNKLVAGLQDNGSNRLENGNFYHEFGADGMDCAIDPSNTNTFYFSYQGGNFYRTNDNGTSITYINPSGQSGNWVTPIQLDPNASSTVYLGFSDVWKSTNQGNAWTNLSNGTIGTDNLDVVKIAPSNSNIIYAGKFYSLYRTTNGGASWSLVFNNIGIISDVAIDPANPNNVWVSFGNYTNNTKVYKSTNGGTSWTNMSGTLPNTPANCLAYDNSGPVSKLYLGTDVGCYVWEATATDWASYSTNLPNVIVKDLEIKHGYLYAGTHGRGFWRTVLSDCPNALSFSGVQSGVSNYEAANSITSTAQLAVGSKIKYKAGKYVLLNPGFISSATTTTTFSAFIAPCGSAFRTEEAPLSGLYTGAMEGVVIAESAKEDVLLHSEQILVFPNPVLDLATIEYHVADATEVSIYLSDATGRRVKDLITSLAHESGDYTTALNVSTLNKGLYICTIVFGNTYKSAKIEVK